MAVGDIGSKNSLVPVLATLQPSPLSCMGHLRSEAAFLTHLIMATDSIFKGRSVRRPSPRHAQAAYHSAEQNVAAAHITTHHRSA
jgi:hypothetical protein